MKTYWAQTPRARAKEPFYELGRNRDRKKSLLTQPKAERMETGAGIQSERTLRGEQSKNWQPLPAGGSTHRGRTCGRYNPPSGRREGLNPKGSTPVTSDKQCLDSLWRWLLLFLLFVCCCLLVCFEGKDIHPSSYIPGTVRGTGCRHCHAVSYLPSYMSSASSSQPPRGQ